MLHLTPPSLHSMQVGSYTYILYTSSLSASSAAGGRFPVRTHVAMCVVWMRGGNILVPRTGITLSFVFRSYVGSYIS